MRIDEYRKTDRYRKTSRWAFVLGPIVFFGIFGLGYLQRGNAVWGRYFSEVLAMALLVSLGLAFLLIVVPYVLWLFGRLDTGFRRLGFVMIPASIIVSFFFWWRTVGWAFSYGRYFEGLLPVVVTAATIMAAYVLVVHAAFWVREGFSKSKS